MSVILIALGVIVGLAVLAFAGIGVWVCFLALPPQESEQTRLAREAQDAEQIIAQIGQRAQQAIMTEAVNRLQERYGWSK